jgi:hypothetical protein
MREGDYQSFYSALSNALTDRTLISGLLAHPEFQSRGRQICYRIAGHEDCDDLFQEVCQRVLRGLNSKNIESERDFFTWFSAVARAAHFREVRSVDDVRDCTEKTRHWPDDSADVALEDCDEFLEHVEGCPYHAQLLRAEEEEIRAVFRRASGLDGRGRLLQGAALEAAIAEHQRRSAIWEEAARRKESPFSYISLYNDGKEIASCGKFFDFSKHVSLNELDVRAGLQIRGINDNDMHEDVLLGFYALAGVRHEGEEQLLHLSNGYTVVLRVKKLGERSFEVHFRCAETKVIEEEQARSGDEAGGQPKAIGNSAGANSSPTARPPSETLPSVDSLLPGANNWLLPQPPMSGQPGAFYASMVVLLLILVALPSQSQHLVANKGGSNLGYFGDKLRGQYSSNGGMTPAAAPTTRVSDKAEGNFVRGTPGRSQATSPSKKSGVRSQNPSSGLPQEAYSVRADGPTAQGARAPAADSDSQTPATTAAYVVAKPDPKVNYQRKVNPKSWQMLLFPDGAGANNSTTLLTGIGEGFETKVASELRRVQIPFQSVPEGGLPAGKYKAVKYKIDLAAIPGKFDEARTTVILVITYFDGDHLVSDQQLYTGNGKSLDLAYVDALRKAITPVFGGEKKPPGAAQSAAIRKRIEEDFGALGAPAQALLGVFSANVLPANHVEDLNLLRGGKYPPPTR